MAQRPTATATRGDSAAGLDGMLGEPGATTLAMVPVEERGLRGLELADAMFTPGQREQIAALLAVPTNSPALMPFLALCIAEGFSPWANHVWLIPKKIKVKSSDGSGEREEMKHLPAVGRDGLLHKARQARGFDLDFGVVCERDSFEAWYEDGSWHVLHRQAHKPTEFADGEAPDRWRGRVVGAWALLHLAGRRPTYYYANLREHGRLRNVWSYNAGAKKRLPLFHDPSGGVTFSEMATTDGVMTQNRPVQEWEGAWDYLSTMILKCAQSYVCRIGLGVTGFVPVDELRSPDEWSETPQAGAPDIGGALDEFDFEGLPVDNELRMRLRRAVHAANMQEAFAWGPAKCQMVLSGRSADELAGIVEQIEAENDLRERRMERAGAGDVVDGEAVEEKADASPDAERPTSNPERVAVLLVQRANLLARRMQATEEQQGDVNAELDQIEAELRELGAPDPGAGPGAG